MSWDRKAPGLIPNNGPSKGPSAAQWVLLAICLVATAVLTWLEATGWYVP